MKGSGLKRLLRTVGVVVLQQVTIFLLSAHLSEGQSQAVGPVVVMAGDDTVLPCFLEPPMDAVQMTMEWARPDLDPRFVYVRHNGRDLLTDQNPSYRGRASLSVDRLQSGDLSLSLSEVKVSDNGRYRCLIPKQSKEYFVELVVGVASSAEITLAGLDKSSGSVELQCESAGWYPEPKVLWLDGEGNLLPAGPPETLRGPDDLYTVSSRVTVDQRHGNNITCRVQQNNINQSSETHIYIPDDFFVAGSDCAATTALSVVFCLMFVSAVAFIFWRWRQNTTQMKTSPHKETEQLLSGIRKVEDLNQKKSKLDEELKKSKEELDSTKQTIEALKEIQNELENQRKNFISHQQEAERGAEENDKKIKEVDKEVTEKDGDRTQIKAQGYLKLKEILTQSNWDVEKRKKGLQQLQMDTEKPMKRTCDEVQRMKERQERIEKDMEEIQKQMEEIQKQMEEIQKQKDEIQRQSEKEGKRRKEILS